jgi:tetratricopeptide (TPR) repeat protein
MLISPLKMSPQDSRSARPFILLPLAAALLVLAAAAARAQGGVESTGTGGNHVIQGRIFLPSGRISDMSLRVKLESMASGALSVLTDPNGAFKFTSLIAGSYTVVVEATDQFEQARESVYIDQQTTGPFRDNTPHVYTVYVYLRPKRPEGAGAKQPPGVVNASLAGVPKPAADLYGKALEAARNNKPEKAVTLLKTALETYPDFRLALSELGTQYLKLKQPEKAAETLRAALKLAPDDYPTLLSYGIALYDRKEFDEAEANFHRAARMNNSSPTAHFYLGVITLRRREFEEAERELRAAAGPGGEIVMAHYYLGGLYWELKQYKRAADELETYLKLAPSAPEAERLRATIAQLRAK